MTTDPDEDILELVEAGHREKATRLLMQRHGTAVYRFVRTALRNRPSTDDVHSRVFIEADRDLPRFRRGSALRTWLFAIARHRVLDEIKSTKNLGAKLEPLEGVDAPHEVPSAAERLDDEQLMRALVACLNLLSEEVRQAVILRYQQGFSFEEISEVCREKPGTLQARVRRALPALKTCIEGRTQSRL